MTQASDRRRAHRRPVLESFALFVVIPKKGFHRLKIHDVSDLGLGFDIDIAGEVPEEFPVALGEALDLRLYLNQSLYLPLKVQVARVEQTDSVRRVGAEFSDKKSQSYKAFQSFLAMLDLVADAARLEAATK